MSHTAPRSAPTPATHTHTVHTQMHWFRSVQTHAVHKQIHCTHTVRTQTRCTHTHNSYIHRVHTETPRTLTWRTQTRCTHTHSLHTHCVYMQRSHAELTAVTPRTPDTNYTRSVLVQITRALSNTPHTRTLYTPRYTDRTQPLCR